MELESLVVPAADAAEEAGKLILNLPKLWAEANQEEKRKLLLSMLDAVYVDAKQSKSIVAIKPKPPFKPIFQVAASREGSDINIVYQPFKARPCFWWRRGRVCLYMKRGLAYMFCIATSSSCVSYSCE